MKKKFPLQILQRYKLTLAYRGTRYHGWQVQPFTDMYKGPRPPEEEQKDGIPTIQGVVRRALMEVVKHPVNLVGSSRTDAGVHAKAQLAHFDTHEIQIPPEGIRRASNARLPDDVVIRAIEPVPDTWDALSSTISKRYQYAIWNARDRNALFSDLLWHRWQPLDVSAMQAAASQLEGEHDFASFVRPGHGRENTIRTVLQCQVSRRGPLVVVGIEGSGFLWNMVRIIVGTLVEIGVGLRRADEIPAMLAAKDRIAAGATAPSLGLYLQWIKTK